MKITPIRGAIILLALLLVAATGETIRDIQTLDGAQKNRIGALLVNLVSGVTGTLPVANGGTGQVTATAAFNALDPLTTQGDMLYHDGTDSVRLAKGTGLQQLRMNSGATAPEWFTASAGGSSSIVVTNLTTATGNGGNWTEIGVITSTATNGTAIVEAYAGSETTSIGYIKIKSTDGTTLEESHGPWNPGSTGLRMKISGSCTLTAATTFKMYVKQDAGSVVYTNVVGSSGTVSSNMLRMVIHQIP